MPVFTPDELQLSPRVWLHLPDATPPPRPEGGLDLVQRVGQAFGNGRHPTTRLCAGAVDLLCHQRHPAAVLDVGTGTGVLARIARARGVEKIVATDIDPDALEEARANIAFDAHPIAIVVEDAPPDQRSACFDLVIANILEGVLLELAPSLVAALAPGADLLLSGFTPAQSPALRVAFTALGLELIHQAELEGWVLLQLRQTTQS